MKLLKY